MTLILSRGVSCVFAASLMFTVGCTSPPPPRQVYQDPLTSIRLQLDERRDGVHSHPAQVSAEQMAAVLNGVRVISRKGFIGSILTGEAQASAAFTGIEIQALAPQLSRALSQAPPEELVTFYRRFTDTNVGLAITSGGLFLQGDHLYFVLANDRDMPSEAMNINLMYEIDPIDNPLLPITRTSFRASFTPMTALVPPDERRAWPYIDQGRVLVIDLPQLRRDLRTDPSQPKH